MISCSTRRFNCYLQSSSVMMYKTKVNSHFKSKKNPVERAIGSQLPESNILTSRTYNITFPSKTNNLKMFCHKIFIRKLMSLCHKDRIIRLHCAEIEWKEIWLHRQRSWPMGGKVLNIHRDSSEICKCDSHISVIDTEYVVIAVLPHPSHSPGWLLSYTEELLHSCQLRKHNSNSWMYQ